MEAKEQYLKYKPMFTKSAILRVVLNAIMFLTLLLLFFLPCFRIQPDIADIGDLIGVDLGINFSLYDETVLAFSSLSSDEFEVLGLIFQVFAIVFFAGGLVATVVDLIKSTMRCINPENYAIIEYDKIKSRTDKQKAFRQFSPTVMFYCAIIYEVFAIVFSKVLNGVIEKNNLAQTYSDYFASMNAVAWGFWIVLILLIVDIALAVFSAQMRNKLKVQILREDYENTNELQKKDSE